MKQQVETTLSICPECNAKIPAVLFNEGGRIWIEKECPEHGKVKDLYYGNSEMYFRAKNYQREGKGIANPNISKKKINCPFDCGLCGIHKTHTGLANIVLTNRCDLRCWYCFFYAKEGGKIYEPSLGQIREMFKTLKAQRPVTCNGIQLTGGEPALREDIIDIVKIAREEGFEHIQFNTNGIRFSQSPDFVKSLRKAGVNTVYLSFDGVTAKTNPKNHWEIPAIIENCRKAKLKIVLVPTIIRGINDHEIGDIIDFALDKIDIVSGVNFQPISFVGKVPREKREEMRITIPDVIGLIEKQNGGQVVSEDFYPVPCVGAFSELVEALTNKPQYNFTTHFVCGAGTYVYRDGRKLVPITRFIDVNGLFTFMQSVAGGLKETKINAMKTIKKAEIALRVGRFIDNSKKPKALDFKRLLLDVLLKNDYSSLGKFHENSLFIGMMHFQDKYNYDIKRVQRCAVHYVTPDKRVIPFCAFNVIPELYRDAIQDKYSIPVKQWEKKVGRKLSDDLFKRKSTDEKRSDYHRKVLPILPKLSR